MLFATINNDSYLCSIMSSPASSTQQQIHTLYTDHHGWLHAWLRKKLGNSWDAADLAHDTFIRMMDKHRLQQLGEEPRAFLTHIAKGLMIDHWRHQEIERAYQETIALLPAMHTPSPETRLLILESLFRIDRMLQAMPTKTRTIFMLAQLDGLTYPQVASQLNLSLITVKRHMRKAFTTCLLAL